MKTLSILILLSFVLMPAFSQKQTVKTENSSQVTANLTLNAEIMGRYKELSERQEKQIEILEKRLSDASETINTQTAEMSKFFSISGWVLGILAVISTISIYLFGIRPADKAVENLEANFDKKINLYFSNQNKKAADAAVSNIESTDRFRVQQGIIFLQLRLNDNLTNEHLLRLINVVKSDEITNNTRLNLVSLLSVFGNDSIYIKSLFNSVLDDITGKYDINAKNIALGFLMQEKYQDEAYDIIKKKITGESQEHIESVFSRIRFNENKYIALKLLNDDEVLAIALKEGQEPEVLKAAQNNVYFNIYEYITDNEIRKTKYFNGVELPNKPINP